LSISVTLLSYFFLQQAELEAEENVKTREGQLEAHLLKAKNQLANLREARANTEKKLDEANTQLIETQEKLKKKQELFSLNAELGRNEILQYKEM